MFQLRRSALRVLTSSPSSFIAKPRALSSITASSIRTRPANRAVAFSPRWASTEAEAKRDEDVETPISELQPTAQEEVENAIHEDNAAVTEEPAPTQAYETTDPPSSERSGFSDAASRYPRPPREKIEPKETIYVGNLFFDVTENDLKSEFARFGPIKTARLLRDTRGLSKGFGYIDFETVEAATAAIDGMHQQLYEGRRIVTQFAAQSTTQVDRSRRTRFDSRQQNPPSKTLFIGNISFEMTDRDLNNLFRGIRNVIDVRVAIDRRTGQPRGFAHADFIDVKSAMEAIKILQEKEVYGRKLRVDYSYGPSTAPKNQPPPE